MTFISAESCNADLVITTARRIAQAKALSESHTLDSPIWDMNTEIGLLVGSALLAVRLVILGLLSVLLATIHYRL